MVGGPLVCEVHVVIIYIYIYISPFPLLCSCRSVCACALRKEAAFEVDGWLAEKERKRTNEKRVWANQTSLHLFVCLFVCLRVSCVPL